MSSQNSCEEDYATRRRRELERDVNQWDAAGWTTEDGIAARRADMDRSVEKEIKAAQHHNQGGHTTRGAGPSNPTFVGSVNLQRAFSHNMQGAIPAVPGLSGFPKATEAIRCQINSASNIEFLGQKWEFFKKRTIAFAGCSHSF